MEANRRGLTLVEVVVVLVIFVLLVAMLLPNVRNVRGASERARCSNNLKQIMLGMHSYHDTGGPLPRSDAEKSRQSFPAGCFGTPDREPDEGLSWQVALLPYLEQDKLFREFDPGRGFTPDSAAALKQLSVFVCPSATPATGPVTTYVAMAGLGEDAARRPRGDKNNGIMGYDRTCGFAEITDGMSNTVALAETNHALSRWAQGGPGTVRAFDAADPTPFGRDHPLGSAHEDGFNVGMCDGSVRVIKFKQSGKVFADAVTVAGGEKTELD